MLFLHETHHVAGYHEDAFEARVPRGLDADAGRGRRRPAALVPQPRPRQRRGRTAVVTVTAVRDGAAWERLARRIQYGDLQDWMRELDTFRHDVHGKVLVPLPWSPMADVDLGAVPTDGAERDPAIYMEDTMWPYEGRLHDYIDASGTVYAKSLEHRDGGEQRSSSRSRPASSPRSARTASREVTLMQRILDPDRLLGLLTTDIPAEMRAPGTWMYDALELRDQLGEPAPPRRPAWSPFPLEQGAALMLFVHETHEVVGPSARTSSRPPSGTAGCRCWPRATTPACSGT